MHSLRQRLLGLWGLSLIASVAVGILLVQLYQQSTAAQVGRAEAVIAHGCDLIRERYGFYVAGWTGPAAAGADARLRSDLATVVGLALSQQQGVEGGIWQAGSGPVAYAFPTYAGTGPKTDLPAAERAQIEAANQLAARNDQAVERRTDAGAETLLLRACPLGGPVLGLTGWTMTRVQATQWLGPLQLGLGALFTLVLAMAVWLGRTLLVWGRHVRGIETALGRGGAEGIPPVPRTGERELDRITDALNDAATRLTEARREADRMAARAARAERLAGLGRVAAGVAHEIRNPIAAARLQGENALAGDDARRRAAIGDMLGQLDRLDALAGELLAMTQRVAPRPTPLVLADLLAAQAAGHRETANAKGVTLAVRAAPGSARLDAAIVGRILDNLLTNAIRHAPPRGSVALAAELRPGLVSIIVEDSGPGVAAEMVEHLFEPFVTGRADGTGLGLAIARELADAHGGRLILLRPGGQSAACGQAASGGAIFALELPQEAGWPPS